MEVGSIVIQPLRLFEREKGGLGHSIPQRKKAFNSALERLVHSATFRHFLPRNFDEATPFQVALVLGELEESQRLFREEKGAHFLPEDDSGLLEEYLEEESEEEKRKVVQEILTRYCASPLFLASTSLCFPLIAWIFERSRPTEQLTFLYLYRMVYQANFDILCQKVKSPQVFCSLFRLHQVRTNKYLRVALWPRLPIRYRERLLSKSLQGKGVFFCHIWDLCTSEEKRMRDKLGNTWLHRAIIASNNLAIQYILSTEPKMVYTTDYFLQTPLAISLLEGGVNQENIARMTKIDGSFSKKILECKLWGHRHDIGLEFEGCLSHECGFFVKALQKSILKFASLTTRPAFALSSIQKIVKIFTCARARDVGVHRENLREQGWTVILLKGRGIEGMEGHIAMLLFTRDSCIKIDTGKRKKIEYFEIKKRESFERALETVIGQQKDEEDWKSVGEYFYEGLDQELGLVVFGAMHDRQIVGNCGWRALKAAFRASLVVEELFLRNLPINQKHVKWAIDNTEEDYIDWERFDRLYASLKILPFFAENSHLFDWEKVIAQMEGRPAEFFLDFNHFTFAPYLEDVPFATYVSQLGKKSAKALQFLLDQHPYRSTILTLMVIKKKREEFKFFWDKTRDLKEPYLRWAYEMRDYEIITFLLAH